jgi:hypothetical protein
MDIQGLLSKFQGHLNKLNKNLPLLGGNDADQSEAAAFINRTQSILNDISRNASYGNNDQWVASLLGNLKSVVNQAPQWLHAAMEQPELKQIIDNSLSVVNAKLDDARFRAEAKAERSKIKYSFLDKKN